MVAEWQTQTPKPAAQTQEAGQLGAIANGEPTLPGGSGRPGALSKLGKADASVNFLILKIATGAKHSISVGWTWPGKILENGVKTKTTHFPSSQR